MSDQGSLVDYRHAVVEITPDLADAWLLDQFEGQRKMRDHHTLMLAQEMENGSFIPHSAIVFAEYENKSYLIDGQHRLKAITLYGKPVSMTVLRRKAMSMHQIQEWYASIDQGLKRTARDAIRAQGLPGELGLTEQQTGRLSAAVKLIATGFMDMTSGISAANKTDRAKTRSNAVVSRLLRVWAPYAKKYFETVQGGESSNMYLFDRAAVVACGLLTIKHNPEKAHKFWFEMSRDDGLSKGDPRKRFLLWLRDSKEKPGNVARGFSVAWRAFIEKREISLIRFEKTGKPLEFRGVPIDDEVKAALEIARQDENAFEAGPFELAAE